MRAWQTPVSEPIVIEIRKYNPFDYSTSGLHKGSKSLTILFENSKSVNIFYYDFIV